MSTAPASASDRRVLRIVATAVFALAFLRLIGFVVRFGDESLQADFAAYYTAGEAANAGLSPYETHPEHDPPIWDGVDRFHHSRFLYPPLAASFFRPWALMPYRVAKHLWMIVSLAAVGVSLWAFARVPGLGLEGPAVPGFAAWVCLFHPLLTLLERGQMDALTLALVSFAALSMARGHDRLAAGASLALATLFKLNVVFALPFLAASRRWRAVLGYVGCAAALALLSLVVDGPAMLRVYLGRELPRIAAQGESGTSEQLLPGGVLLRLRAGLPENEAAKDGRVYQRESFGFVANASLARLAAGRVGTGESRTTANAALILFVVLFLPLAWWRLRRPGGTAPVLETAYWGAAMVAILICGPLTWVMNLVWLLPIGLVVLRPATAPRTATQAVGLCVGFLGLLLASLPDRHAFPLLSPYGGPILDSQYLAAEVLVFASLAVRLFGQPRETTVQ